VKTLFNLFIRPILETANCPAYTGDSYYRGYSRNKRRALEILQRKINAAERWMADCGLKVILNIILYMQANRN
jgi:hypothetical protein